MSTTKSHVEKVETTTYPAGRSPLELLPPEMAEIVIKTAMADMDTNGRHDYLVDVIAKVSTRMKALAMMKSLWRGQVIIRGNEEKLRRVIHGGFLSEGITHLKLVGQEGATIYENDILAVAEKCPKLEVLDFTSVRLRSWPTFTDPFTSLKRLEFCRVRFNSRMFPGVQLHQSIPNLIFLRFVYCESIPSLFHITLPLMEHCNMLRDVWLDHGKFTVTSLPRCLENLIVSYSDVNIDPTTLTELRSTDRFTDLNSVCFIRANL